MKGSKILFLISITGILLLLFISALEKNLREGTIKEIKYSNNRIAITLENQNETIIIFSNKIINLKKEDKILFSGKTEDYKGQKQIIADKIYKEND